MTTNIEHLFPLIQEIAGSHGLDPHLVAAVVMTESGVETWAMRFEPNYRWLYQPAAVKPPLSSLKTEETAQKTSFGLMQVMGAVARERGFRGWLTELCRPEVGLEYGCRHLAWLFARHQSIDEAVSAYNQGSPRRGPDERLLNQEYVDRVLSLKTKLAQTKTS